MEVFLHAEVITKVYKTHPENEFNSTLEYEKIYVEDPIRWKAGKNITVEMVPKKVSVERISLIFFST